MSGPHPRTYLSIEAHMEILINDCDRVLEHWEANTKHLQRHYACYDCS